MRWLPLVCVAAVSIPGGALAQVTDPEAIIPSSGLSAPAAGATVTDPAFGVTIKRLTDRGENGGLATAEYPQLQAVNADETRILVSTETDYRVMDIATGQVTHTGIELSMPRWHPMLPNVLIGFNQRSGGNIQFQHLELLGGGMTVTTDVVNISNLGFTSLTLGSWEEASADGRYIPIHNQSGGSDQCAVVDTVMGTVAVEVNTGGVDWVGVSPSGRYMAVQHTQRGTDAISGLVIYDVATANFLGHATDHHEHGDLGIDAAGNEVFGTVAWTDLCAQGEAPCFSVSPLPNAVEAGTLQNRRVFNPPVGNYTSCRAERRGGFCLSSDDYGRPGGNPFRGEIWLNRMSDGAVLRLAHHRSSANSYYQLVRPTLSPTGRFALFTSDWAGSGGADQADLYLVDLSPFLDDFLGGGPPPPDAGVLDTGAPVPDAGFDDLGQPVDSGPSPDAGVAPRDAGASIADADVVDTGAVVPLGGTSGGCACATSNPAASLLTLGFVAALFARRRRR